MNMDELYMMAIDGTIDLDARYAIVRQMQNKRQPKPTPVPVDPDLIRIIERTRWRRQQNRRAK